MRRPVHTLNLRRAAEKIPGFVAPQTLLQVQTDIREVTNAGGGAGGVQGTGTPQTKWEAEESLGAIHISNRSRALGSESI